MNRTDQEMYAELAEMRRIVPDERLSISCVGIDSSVSDERVRQFFAYCGEILGV